MKRIDHHGELGSSSASSARTRPDPSARSGVEERQVRPAMSVTSTTSCTVASGAVPVMRTEGTSSAGPSTGSTMSSTLPSTLGVQPPRAKLARGPRPCRDCGGSSRVVESVVAGPGSWAAWLV